jgi:hemoglobin
MTQTVYEAAGGEPGLLRLAEAWHRRVLEDDVVAHAFSHGVHPHHVRRLAAYWVEALGGPPSYTTRYGDESSVLGMHSGMGPHEDMDHRAVNCFDKALTDVGFDDDDGTRPLRTVLHDYFAWATFSSMNRFPETASDVPGGLSIPRWSWDGLQG